jgi:hypothetical protein
MTTTTLTSYLKSRGVPAGTIEYALALAPLVKRRLKQNRIYAKIHSVSRSGMSRRVSLYVMTSDGDILCLDPWFGTIYGDQRHQAITRALRAGTEGVVIGGCGFDAMFEAVYRLFRRLFPRTPYQAYCRYKTF